jgi:hypothetical protein
VINARDRVGPESLAPGQLEQLDLPQPCIHEDFLENQRRSIYGIATTSGRPHLCCPDCGREVKDNSALKARDVPAIVHAAVFYSTFFLIYKLIPLGKIYSDFAMWGAWLVTFAVNYRMRTPLSAARNAILILWLVDTVMIYAHFWQGMALLTYDQVILHAVNSLMAAMIAVTPMFVSRGIRFLLQRLKDKALAANLH